MKISYRTHPVLQKLKDEKLNVIGIRAEYKAAYEKKSEIIKNVWYKLSPVFRENIRYFSSAYCDAFTANRSKIVPEAKSYVEQEVLSKTGAGTLLLKNGYSFCYFFDFISRQRGAVQTCCFLFQNNTLLAFALDLFDKIDESDGSDDVRKWEYPSEKSCGDAFGLLVHFLTFLKYCPIETKTLAAQSKAKGIECKYINDTDLLIEHIDSSWFTNLHVSGAFKVRGHLRLQPKKKDGEWTKEWIWIKEFEKHGYTRKAGILSEG